MHHSFSSYQYFGLDHFYSAHHEQHAETSPLIISHGGLDHEHDDDHEIKKQKQRNVNLHAAYLHVMGDLAQSLAVFLGGKKPATSRSMERDIFDVTCIQ